jgi:hypothetical protein
MSTEYKLMNDKEDNNDTDYIITSNIVKFGVPIIGGIIGGLTAGPLALPATIVAKVGSGVIVCSASTVGAMMGDISRRVTERFINLKYQKEFDETEWYNIHHQYVNNEACPKFMTPVCYKRDTRKYIKKILESDRSTFFTDINRDFFTLYKQKRERNNTCPVIISDVLNYSKYLCKTFDYIFDYMDTEDKNNCFNEIELYIFLHVYNNIIFAYKEKYRKEDEKFYRQCLELRNHLETDILEIGEKLNKKKCYKFLKDFEKLHTPKKKLMAIESLIRTIPEENDLCSDDLISALIYILVEYSPTRIYSNLAFIDDFRNHNNGLYEYLYVTLFCAVKSIGELKRC